MFDALGPPATSKALSAHPRVRPLQVLEFLQHDLEQVIKDTSLRLVEADIKGYMKSFLESLATCHDAWVLHRDIKPNNLLIAANGRPGIRQFVSTATTGGP